MPRPTPARRTQAEPHLQPTPTLADIANAVEDQQKKVLSVATGSPLGQLHLSEKMFRRNPHILGFYQDLSKIFQRSSAHFNIQKNPKNLEFRIFNSLYQCFKVYEHVVDLCSWFPALRLRYARVFGAQFPTACMPPDNSLASNRYRALFYSSFTAKECSRQRVMPTMYTILNVEFLKATNTWHKVHLKDGTVVELVRRYAYRSEYNAFLTALGIEERVRDYIRQRMGLPDWYGLPENRNRTIPPWRAVQPAFRPHAETVIPTEDVSEREVLIQPPLLLETPRRSEYRFDPATSCPEQLSGSSCEPSTRQEQDDPHLPPLCSSASPASTVVSTPVSHDTNPGLSQPDMHPRSFTSKKVERKSSKRRMAPDLRSLYSARSPLSAGQRVRRQDKGPHSRTADIGLDHRTKKSKMTSFETNMARVLEIHQQQAQSESWRALWTGKALDYLYRKQNGRDAALSSALTCARRPTNVSVYLYESHTSPLQGGRSVTRNSGFDMTDLSTSNRMEPYGSYNSTNAILEPDNSNTQSTGAELTIAGATTSTRRTKRTSVLQKPYRGCRVRPAVAPTEQNEDGRPLSKKQNAVSPGRKSSPRYTRTHDLVRRNESNSSFQSPDCRSMKTGSPFWQKRSTEAVAAAKNVNSATERDTTNPAPLGHASNQSSDADDRNQSRGMTGPRKCKTPPDYSKTAFGKSSIIMTGNKVWLDEQAPGIAPTFTSFDPVERVNLHKKGPRSEDPSARGNTPARSARSGSSVEEQEKHEKRETGGGNITKRVFQYITRGKYL